MSLIGTRFILHKSPVNVNQFPGKELIQKIIKDKSFIDFNEYYKSRVDWVPFPVTSDKHQTYTLFADLMIAFPNESEIINTFIDYSIEIAKQESDIRFINAIYLILDFCLKAKRIGTPTKTQIQKIIELRPRVQKLSFVVGMSYWWNQIMDYCAMDSSFDKKLFAVNETDYKNLMKLDFPSIDNNTPKSCPVMFDEIERRVEPMVGIFEPLKFVRSAEIESDKYWVWLYKNIGGGCWSFYIIVKEDENRTIKIETAGESENSIRSIDKMLLDYHYNPFLILSS